MLSGSGGNYKIGYLNTSYVGEGKEIARLYLCLVKKSTSFTCWERRKFGIFVVCIVILFLSGEDY